MKPMKFTVQLDKTGRNLVAEIAGSRTSAGAMKDKRTPRAGAHNTFRDALDIFAEDQEIAQELAALGEE